MSIPVLPTPSRHSGYSRTWLLIVLFALAGGGAWLGWVTYLRPADAATSYQYAQASRGDIEHVVTATGTLQPRDYVDVGAQVSGQLRKVHVDIGAQVKAGDLLAEIDPTVLQSRVDATRAQLRFQRAQLLERQSTLALARTQLQRQKNLIAEDATTLEAVQSAQAALNAAQAQIEALQAQIEQTTSNLRADEANLNYARIYAPMSGTVVSVSARLGQTINATQQAPVLLRIADLSTMTVKTQVSEADVSKLTLGMPAWFNRLGSRDQRWHGTLRKIEPTPEVQNNVVLYNALFDVPNPDQRLMTQMTAQVFFVVASANDALLVPVSALNAPTRGERPTASAEMERPRGPRPAEATDARTSTVTVALPSGAFEQRQVETGISNRIQVQILSGLAEGDRVVSGVQSGAATARRGPGKP
ncbi:MAG: efflux RND transporter periplasmic adaptor subunit [Rhodocyclales bacterium]|nr:efflux RND transporter periplasmic adaptor subunit [Rhodocyclales bacterium]